MTYEPNDLERDEALGRALRDALAVSDSSMFSARVMSRVRDTPVRTWDTLSRWSMWGIPAAAAVVAIALLFPAGDQADASVESALATPASVEVTELTAGDAAPDAGVLFTSLSEVD
jgi:hypothetical protein